MSAGVHEGHAEVTLRLSKIEGHVRSIKTMVETGRPCDQILVQMVAVRSAMESAAKLLLEDHYDHCLVERNQDPTLAQELQDFRKVLGSFVK